MSSQRTPNPRPNNTGGDHEPGLACRQALHAARVEMLDTRYLVARRAIIFGELCFDDYPGIELALDQEVALPLGLMVADARTRRLLRA